MRILFNCSKCKAGGGIQVADSICRNLHRYPQHQFTIVLSDKMAYLAPVLEKFPNVKVELYTAQTSLKTLLTGRDTFLDGIVERDAIDAVFIVFGPSTWRPRVKTISGFAMGHLVLQDSPYWKTAPKSVLLKTRIRNALQKKCFDRLTDCYYTENPFITERFAAMFPHKRVVTISNTCHQVFDEPSMCDSSVKIPTYDGFSLLSVCANYPHKNLGVIPAVLTCLRDKYPELNIRFVLTLTPQELHGIEPWMEPHLLFLGRTNINQCPSLYRQTDAMFLPTMLECFSASYVEAMKMERPILTSDLGFAHSLCGGAAVYFDPTDPADIADKIAAVASNPILRLQLDRAGKEQLQHFDTAQSRTDKIISLIEKECAQL